MDAASAVYIMNYHLVGTSCNEYQSRRHPDLKSKRPLRYIGAASKSYCELVTYPCSASLLLVAQAREAAKMMTIPIAPHWVALGIPGTG